MGSSCAAAPTTEWPKVPRRVLKAARQAGGPSGKVVKAPGEDLWLVTCRHGDRVYGIMDEWISSLPDGAKPFVNVQYAPAFHLLGTALCPPNAAVFDLMREASSVVYHHCSVPVPRASLGGGPLAQPLPIPGPLEGPVGNIFVPHANVALGAIQDRIQHLNQADDYPILSGLPRGSYICTLNISWMNAVQAVTLFKP
jgi:hypothetical protein